MQSRLLGQTQFSKERLFPQVTVPGQTEGLHPFEEIWITVSPIIEKKIKTLKYKILEGLHVILQYIWLLFHFSIGYFKER